VYTPDVLRGALRFLIKFSYKKKIIVVHFFTQKM